MLINEIIPYEKNARHNEKAIPVVADSIREFGLRGQIVLESRDNPVIVTGHTRVAACKLLGWTEIPDENIVFDALPLRPSLSTLDAALAARFDVCLLFLVGMFATSFLQLSHVLNPIIRG